MYSTLDRNFIELRARPDRIIDSLVRCRWCKQRVSSIPQNKRLHLTRECCLVAYERLQFRVEIRPNDQVLGSFSVRCQLCRWRAPASPDRCLTHRRRCGGLAGHDYSSLYSIRGFEVLRDIMEDIADRRSNSSAAGANDPAFQPSYPGAIPVRIVRVEIPSPPYSPPDAPPSPADVLNASLNDNPEPFHIVERLIVVEVPPGSPADVLDVQEYDPIRSFGGSAHSPPPFESPDHPYSEEIDLNIPAPSPEQRPYSVEAPMDHSLYEIEPPELVEWSPEPHNFDIGTHYQMIHLGDPGTDTGVLCELCGYICENTALNRQVLDAHRRACQPPAVNLITTTTESSIHPSFVSTTEPMTTVARCYVCGGESNRPHFDLHTSLTRYTQKPITEMIERFGAENAPTYGGERICIECFHLVNEFDSSILSAVQMGRRIEQRFLEQPSTSSSVNDSHEAPEVQNDGQVPNDGRVILVTTNSIPTDNVIVVVDDDDDDVPLNLDGSDDDTDPADDTDSTDGDEGDECDDVDVDDDDL